jgi:endonuclease-3 related protein
MQKKLMAMYRALHHAYGPQQWWPGDTPFEVMVGAVLTQNTAWANVEKAIVNLKRERLLTPAKLHRVPPRKLASLIRPSGYYNIKAGRLRNLVDFIQKRHSGSLKKMFAVEPSVLRRDLLGINGIGRETADSILLYAGEKPFFVVDAYTKRIFSRHGLIDADADYDETRKLFTDHLRPDVQLYNEYHALIVRVGKERCRKREPRCSECPLKPFLN